MANKNVVMNITFTKRLKSYWLTNAENFSLGKNSTIVVNVGNDPVIVETPPPTKSLPPRLSTILKGVTFKSGDSIVCIEIPDDLTNIGGVILDDDWSQLNKLAHSYPADIPLYKSAQFSVGRVRLDPYFVCGQANQQEDSRMREFQVKVNLWFCPARTNCGLHNAHASPEILEVHTQVYGTGRMQKFRTNDLSSLYEDVIIDPGTTHAPFAGVKQDGGLYYGWHQYYSDTDCIWMANEFHPVSSE